MKNFMKEHLNEILNMVGNVILGIIGIVLGKKQDASDFSGAIILVVIVSVAITLFILNYFEIRKEIKLKRMRNILLNNNYKEKSPVLNKKYKCPIEMDSINYYKCEMKEEIIKDYIKNKSPNDILELLLDNMAELEEHYLINKNQARLSFWFTIFNGVLGIFLLCYAVYQTLSEATIQNIIIIAVAGVILEVFSIISLMIHKNNVIQLNRYYDALHEKDMFLSAISLVRNLDLNKQDEMYIEIIRSELDVRNNCIQNKTPLYRKR